MYKRQVAGRQESTAEHSWRLCLIALALEDELPGIDTGRLLRLLVVHDLGEAVSGDIPAPLQTGSKDDEERADLATLAAPLPAPARDRILALWDEYAAAETPEARLAKGLDRVETLLHHVEGGNPPGFDYAFNLDYGRDRTDAHPLTAALRAEIDRETRRRAAEG